MSKTSISSLHRRFIATPWRLHQHFVKTAILTDIFSVKSVGKIPNKDRRNDPRRFERRSSLCVEPVGHRQVVNLSLNWVPDDKKPSLNNKEHYVLLLARMHFLRPFTLDQICFMGDLLTLLSPKPELRRLNFRHPGNGAEGRDLPLAEWNRLPRPRVLFL